MPDLNELKQKIRQMEYTSGIEQMSDGLLNMYLQRQLDPTHASFRASETMQELYKNNDEIVAQHLVELMMIDTEAGDEMESLLPALGVKKQMEYQRLQDDIGANKQRKSAANKKLNMIRKRQGAVAARRRALEQGNEQPAVYQSAEQREMERGSRLGFYNPLRSLMNSQSLGSKKDRHEDVSYPTVTGAIQEPLAIQTRNGILRGQIYKPRIPEPSEDQQTNQRHSGKLVIIFSGSGGPGASMIEEIVKTYIAAGAMVMQADYRGFGKSETQENNRKTSTHLCEDSIYQDGKDMLNYALTMTKNDVTNETFLPSDIILHGFSLGGAVASKVAADFSEQNAQKLGRGETVNEEDRLGGVVLNSAIATMREAAADSAGFGPAGTIGEYGSGAYNTREHMRRLFRYDPNLPVHYCSGKEKTSDHLGLDVTNLHADPEATFVNSSYFIGSGSHMDTNMDRYNESIRKMAQNGRSANIKPSFS